ncbi:MAG: L-glutamate gamma-semialdehyde dehydrogenase [Polyangiaceae bacterium]
MFKVPTPENEPVLAYRPDSPERRALEAQVAELGRGDNESPLWIAGEPVTTREMRDAHCPHRHAQHLVRHSVAGPAEVTRALEAARRARKDWAALPASARAAVFLRAAALLAGPWRQRVNAATVLNQSKTPHQAEIDAACELIDFFRFNAHFAEQLASAQPLSEPSVWNRSELRPLDGFVYAVTPFNFTSIAANLPAAPALMGNTVIWKPSPHAVLAAQVVMELFTEAGVPPGVINMLHGDAAQITAQLLAEPDFAGLHFTGSTAVLKQLFTTVGQHIDGYRTYPRIVGESGGKDFIIAHPSADVTELCVAALRGAYEFQGQKCSAASRLYVPKSLWPALSERLVAEMEQLRMGDPMEAGIFLGAVIGKHAFDRISAYQALARDDAKCKVLAGGGGDESVGYFVQPTLVVTEDPKHRLMQEEIFGPLLTAFVYDDARFEQVLSLCDETSPYALTGAVFARDRAAIAMAEERLRFCAGNFYINDKPTGAVVGQQPFGGGRASGTNDKAGAAWNLMRWASPRSIKENLAPPRDWRYPFLG